jgi:hypothetical protein
MEHKWRGYISNGISSIRRTLAILVSAGSASLYGSVTTDKFIAETGLQRFRVGNRGAFCMGFRMDTLILSEAGYLCLRAVLEITVGPLTIR